jgi:Flp pilus assembly protein TadD
MAGLSAEGFGALLRRLRYEAGLTQEELAEGATLSPRSVSDLARGVTLTTRKLVCGDMDQAEACHRQALKLAHEVGSSCSEAQALAGLGRCALAAGRSADAVRRLRQAREIFHRIGRAEAARVTAELVALQGASPSA